MKSIFGLPKLRAACCDYSQQKHSAKELMNAATTI
jgi:hypothetical protein